MPAAGYGPPLGAGGGGRSDRQAAAESPGEEGHREQEEDVAGRARSILSEDFESVEARAHDDFKGPFFLVGSWDDWEGFTAFSLETETPGSRTYMARRYFSNSYPEGNYSFLISRSKDLQRCFFPKDWFILGPLGNPTTHWTVCIRPSHWLEVRWEVIHQGLFLYDSLISWRVGQSVVSGADGFCGLLRAWEVDELLHAWELAPPGAEIGWDCVESTFCIEYEDTPLRRDAWKRGGNAARMALHRCSQDRTRIPGFNAAVRRAEAIWGIPPPGEPIKVVVS